MNPFCRFLQSTLITAAVFAFFFDAYADQTLYPGIRTISLLNSEYGIKTDIAVWYPTYTPPKKLRYPDWDITAARQAPFIPETCPLLILSHDMAGSRFSNHQLCASLAQNGFIVAAVTHRFDCSGNIKSPFMLEQITERVKDLKALLDILLTSSPFSASVDSKNIGVIGIGPGATAALLLAGGRLDGAGWSDYCYKAGKKDPYCSPWAASRMEHTALSIDPDRIYADKRIRAAAAVAPNYGMLFSSSSLQNLTIPLLLLRADLDAVNMAPHHAEAIRRALPIAPEYGVIAHADHAALMSPCSHETALFQPDICIPAPPADRTSAQRQLASVIVRFMNTRLKAYLNE